jgi:serine/threonine protein kinase
MHNQNPPIIHRDIKPANIRVTPQGKAVLVDFGIAKQQAGGRTRTGARGVTSGYSPPEQYTGQGTSVRSDVYALGATLYTLLTDLVLPESIQRLITSGGTAPVVVKPPHMIRPGITTGVSQVIMLAIHPDPAKRFVSVKEFEEALRSGPSGARVGQQSAASLHRPPAVSPPVLKANQSVLPLNMQQRNLSKAAPSGHYGGKGPTKRNGKIWLGIGLTGLLFVVLIGLGIYFSDLYSQNQGQPISIAGQFTRTFINRTTTDTVAPPSVTETASASATSAAATETANPSATINPAMTSTPDIGVSTSINSTETASPNSTLATFTPDDFNGVKVSYEDSRTSGIRVEYINADNSPLTNVFVEIHKQTVDVSNNPLHGDRVDYGNTDKSGSVFFELTPATYAISLNDNRGYPWGDPFNHVVQSGKTTVVRIMLGRMIIGIRNADEQPLTGNFISIFRQNTDLLGNPVRGDRVSYGNTNAAGAAVFDLTPGLYTIEINDLLGEVWGERMNHAILPGQSRQLIITTGKVTVGIINADGQPVEGLWVGIHYQKSDVSGNPAMGDRFVGGSTNNTGAVSWNVTTGTYGINISGLNGYHWGDPMNHSVTSGQNTIILVELGRLVVGIKDGSGNPVQGKWVAVHYQRKDASGNITKGDRIDGRSTDNAGLVGFDLTPGDYILEVDKRSLNVTVVPRKITFTDSYTVEYR